MPIPDPPDREWLQFSPNDIEEYVGGVVGTIVAEYAAEVAHLKREVAYLEARLAAEKQTAVEEALS